MRPSLQAPAATAFSRVGVGSDLIAERAPTRPRSRRSLAAPPTMHETRTTSPQEFERSMSDTDTKSPSDKTLHLSSPKTLSIKRPVEHNTVRQSFSHGRSKAVVVETVKRRAGPAPAKDGHSAPAAKAAPAAPAAAPSARRTLGPATPAAPAAPAAAPTPAPATRPSGMVLRTLSDSERDARASALAEAREREEEERRQKEDERKRRAEDEARRRLGEETVPQRGVTSARLGPGEARRPRSLDHMGRPESVPATDAGATARPSAAPVARAPGRPVQAEDEAEGKRIIRRPGMPTRIITPPKAPKAPGGDRNRGRLTIATATGGEDERTRSIAS